MGKHNKGQTALILILLAAAALIFYAVTVNWGRIAQTKSMLTIATNQAASYLASEAASYGEMQKQTYLRNVNRKAFLEWQVFFAVIMIVLAIIVTILSYGTTAAAFGPIIGPLIATVLAVIAITVAVVSLLLQLFVVQPGMERMWNALEKNQTDYQQMFEQGISTAIQGAVTDQVSITDYFDSNTNGAYGLNSFGFPKDTVSRFGFFYTERLKMLNSDIIPQVKLFYDQLGEFMNGETCGQNALENNANGLIPFNSACPSACDSSGISPSPGCQVKIPATETCAQNAIDNHKNSMAPLNPACSAGCSSPSSTDPNCLLIVSNPFSFQLNDPCTDSNNPYCDPCCQLSRSASCQPSPLPADCKANPEALDCIPPECLGPNNPYNAYGSYPYLYDATYQEYSKGLSFLDQFGRDQQMLPSMPLKTMTLQGNFPNGIFPFFWLMKDYSPQVDNINPTTKTNTNAQLHWCSQATTSGSPNNGVNISAFSNTTGFSILDQLSLPYTCQGKDCCVNFLADKLGTIRGSSTALTPVYSATPINKFYYGSIDMVADPSFMYQSDAYSLTSSQYLDFNNPALDPVFGETAPIDAAPAPTTPTVPDPGFGAPPPVQTFTYWSEGDNQMCSAPSAWPYNGASPAFEDGTCEWNNSVIAPAPNNMPVTTYDFLGNPIPPGSGWIPSYTINPAVSSLDGLDDTMHTLSDFVTFSSSILSQSVWNLSATFHNWYPQAAKWIAPGCAKQDAGTVTTCVKDYGGQCTPCVSNKNPCPPVVNSCNLSTDPNCLLDDYSCNTSGEQGRLLNIYDPPGYPLGSSADVTFSAAYTINNVPVDRLKEWNEVITKWLGISYTPASATLTNPYPWCVPPETTASGLEVVVQDQSGNRKTVKTSEADYIEKNSPPTTCPSQANTACPASGKCSNGDPCSQWGNLPQVIACLNYNSSQNTEGVGPEQNYTKCQTALAAIPKTTACPASLSANTAIASACAAQSLGRDLLSQTPPSTNNPNNTNPGWCHVTTSHSTYADWVNDSLTLFTDEAPKFALRSGFLTDIYTRAQNMQNILAQGDLALAKFFLPCSGAACVDGGPAAQLIYAANPANSASRSLPNAVIYGWVDKPPVSSGGCTDSSGKISGCAHIVKATAYSPERGAQPKLPWIYSFTSYVMSNIDPVVVAPIAFKNYVLTNRDGWVYASVKRWDEDHNPVTFPNTHPLWQFMMHNPKSPNTSTSTGTGFPPFCQGMGMSTNDHRPVGFGLEQQTVSGLENAKTDTGASGSILQQDQTYLSQAFMLNDNGNGQVDPGALNGSADQPVPCSLNPNRDYCRCLSWANKQLDQGMESHACAQYIAWRNASAPSGASEVPKFSPGFPSDPTPDPKENDYSVRFTDCGSLYSSLPDDADMAYEDKSS